MIPYAGQEYRWTPSANPVPALGKSRRAAAIAAICDRTCIDRAIFLEIKLLRARRKIAELTEDRRRSGSARRIMENTAAAYGVSVADIVSEGRTRALCRARFAVCYALAERTLLSLCQIGKLIGKDHTSVRNGIIRHIEFTGVPSVRGILPKHSKPTPAD